MLLFGVGRSVVVRSIHSTSKAKSKEILYIMLTSNLYFEQKHFESIHTLFSGSEKQTKLSTNKLNFDQDHIIIYVVSHLPSIIILSYWGSINVASSQPDKSNKPTDDIHVTYFTRIQTDPVGWIEFRDKSYHVFFGRNYEQRQIWWGLQQNQLAKWR